MDDSDAAQLSFHLEVEACETCLKKCEELERKYYGPLLDLPQPTTQFPAEPAQIDAARQTIATARRRTLTPVPFAVDGFEIKRRLGEGGMGDVFEAWDQELQRTVALKCIHRSRAKDVQRFAREMQITAQLNDSAAVRAHAHKVIGSVPCFVMEYIDGTDLSKLRKSVGQLRYADACELIRQSAAALQSAHETLGVVHRDVKPANLMLAMSGNVRLLDLGLAMVESESDKERLTSEGHVLGSLDYISPEQLNHDTVDHRADVYSLGVTFYYLLCGTVPFRDARRLTERLERMQNENYVPVASHRADVPAEIGDLVDQMLAFDPASRVQSAGEVQQRVEKFCDGADLQQLAQQAREKHPLTTPSQLEVPFRLTASDDPPATTPSSSSAQQKRMSRTLWLVVIGSIVAAAWINPFKTSVDDQRASKTDRNNKPAAHAGADWIDVPLTTPPLEEWLRGRNIVTVSQDGTADHTSIQEALESVTSGDAIHVLDEGPYREVLWLVQPATTFGIYSTAGTVVDLAEWDVQTNPGDARGHYLSGKNLRISGITFRNPPVSVPSAAQGLLVQSDATIENCVFRREGKITALLSSGLLAGNHSEHHTGLLVIRNCVFDDTRLTIYLGAGVAQTAIAEHNLIIGNEEPQGLRLGLNDIGTFIARENALLNTGLYVQRAEEGFGGSVNIERNTIVNAPLPLGFPAVVPHLHLHDNVLLGRHEISIGHAEGGTKELLAAVPTWDISGNVLTIHDEPVQAIELSGRKTTEGAAVTVGSVNLKQSLTSVHLNPDSPEFLQFETQSEPADQLQTKGIAGIAGTTTYPNWLQQLVARWAGDTNRPAAPAKSDGDDVQTVPTGPLALQFDGRNDFVRIPAITCDGLSAMTLETVVSIDERMRPEIGQILRVYGDASPSLWITENHQFAFHYHHLAGTVEFQQRKPWTGRTAHLAAVCEQSTARFYVDGKLIDQTSATDWKPKWNRGGLVIGASLNSQPVVFFHGTIEEIRISDTARYTTEFTPQFHYQPDEHTVGLYHCDTMYENQLRDSSGHDNHGTIVGATWRKRISPKEP